MALTYAQSAALMRDSAFIDRVKVAILKYAEFILNESPATQGHAGRYRWAQAATVGPDSAAQTTTPPVVIDPSVQLDGAAITDAALQTAVETVVNKLI